MKTYDLTIVGAGPVGLYATFYAGMIGLNVKLIEASEQLGGQPASLYPEKKIYDIPGLPAISAHDLTENLIAQLETVEHTTIFGQKLEKITGEIGDFTLHTNQEKHHSRAILLTTGSGQISPRKLGIDQEDELNAQNKLNYFIRNLAEYHEKNVVIFGGGDSALDMALMLENVATEVHLIHRRKDFRAHDLTVKQLENSTIQVHKPFALSDLTGNEIHLTEIKGENHHSIKFDKILVNYGFLTTSAEFTNDMKLARNNKIAVNQVQESSISGIYAAGDSCEYDGKVHLIALGFGESIRAITNMTKTIQFPSKIRHGHSSSLF